MLFFLSYYVLGGLILSFVLYLTIGVVVRKMAEKEFYFAIPILNTLAFIVTKDDGKGNFTQGGGGEIKGILNGLQGKHIERDPLYPEDPLKWKVVDGADAQDSLLYRHFGVVRIGLFRALRTNDINRVRFIHADENSTPQAEDVPEKELTKHAFFSGEQAVVIENADTDDGWQVNLKINLTFERTFPVRSLVYVGQPHSFIESLVQGKVNDISRRYSASEFLGVIGKTGTTRGGKGLLYDIAREIEQEVSQDTLTTLGFTLTLVVVRDVDVSEEYREAVGATKIAESLGEAKVAAAEASRRAAGKIIEAQADWVREVAEPTSGSLKSILATAVLGWAGVKPPNPSS